MSHPLYVDMSNHMTDEQRDIMWYLYMSGVNRDGHTWVTYSAVEEAVAKLVQSFIEKENK